MTGSSRGSERRGACEIASAWTPTAYRVVNAEGDFLPGLVIDLYADTAVVCPHTRGVEARLDGIADCLCAEQPGLRVFVRRDEHFARVEKLSVASGYLRGAGDGATVITEGRCPAEGGFCARAENRLLPGPAGQPDPHCTVQHREDGSQSLFLHGRRRPQGSSGGGRESYLRGQLSERARARGRQRQPLSRASRPTRSNGSRRTSFPFSSPRLRCDVVVADPPPFARRRVERDGALKGYLSLYQQCLRILSPGGLAFLFSCSGAVDRPTFQQVVGEAALRSGRTARLLSELHADVDHPVAASHPEGEYLKGWMVHVQ